MYSKSHGTYSKHSTKNYAKICGSESIKQQFYLTMLILFLR